jgi:hypothetical protein
MLVKRCMELHDEIITKPQNKTYAYAMHNRVPSMSVASPIFTTQIEEN